MSETRFPPSQVQPSEVSGFHLSRPVRRSGGRVPTRRNDLEVPRIDLNSPPVVPASPRGPFNALLHSVRWRRSVDSTAPRVVVKRLRGESSVILPSLTLIYQLSCARLKVGREELEVILCAYKEHIVFFPNTAEKLNGRLFSLADHLNRRNL